MEKRQLIMWTDRLGVALVLAVALILRSDLSYRTAFVDEAINLFEGWQMLRGQETYLSSYYIGWPALTVVPLGLAGWLGGLEAARALNAVLGTLAVGVVMMIARQLYGRTAGYIAAGVVAVFGPAIHVSTFATYDSQSVLLLASGLFLWQRGLSGNRRALLSLGSLAMMLAVLTKYVALLPAATAAAWVALTVLTRGPVAAAPGAGRKRLPGLIREALAGLAFMGLPLLLLFGYGLHFRGALMGLWQATQGRILQASAGTSGLQWGILKSFVEVLGLPLVVSLPSLWHRKWQPFSLGLLATGLSVVVYHLLAAEYHAVVKHTGYVLVAWAPPAAGGLALTVDRLLGRWLRPAWRATASGLLGLVLVGVVAVSGRAMLPNLQSAWPDTASLMHYLRPAVQEGDTMLVEQGAIARYYLIEKGTPGHRPGQVVDTWWYQDEEGQGPDAYKRALARKRFDWVVFDYVVTPELDRELLPLLEAGYERQASFPACIYGQYGTIDVFKARP